MEVLKEKSHKVWRGREGPSRSALRTSTSSWRYFVATGQTETKVSEFSGSLFLEEFHNQHFPEHSFVIVFSSSWTLSLKVQATFGSPCKNASPIRLDRNPLFKRSTFPILPSCLQEAVSKHFGEPFSKPAELQTSDGLKQKKKKRKVVRTSEMQISLFRKTHFSRQKDWQDVSPPGYRKYSWMYDLGTLLYTMTGGKKKKKTQNQTHKPKLKKKKSQWEF